MNPTNKITIGVTNLSFHRIAASLVSNTLVNMGFEVEQIYAHHEENFDNLKTGKVDMLSSAWLPSSHGIYKAQTEETVSLIDLGLHYEPYALWGVPDYVPQEMVRNIADLTKPEVVDKMRNTIQGINPGAGITRFSIKMMKEYGLSDAGYKFFTGTEEACFDAFEDAVQSNSWVVVPLWRPQFLNYKYNIRELEDPKGLLGVVDKAVLLLRADRKEKFTKAQIEKLDGLKFSNSIIEALDWKVSKEGKPIDQVTKDWLSAQN
ncbi:MAG: glycine betaine ABC transporter substrate-binding protein [Bacteroidota bacterium]